MSVVILHPTHKLPTKHIHVERHESRKETILTMDQIAEKFGVDVKTLKIVK
jgi:hypothetical protein